MAFEERSANVFIEETSEFFNEEVFSQVFGLSRNVIAVVEGSVVNGLEEFERVLIHRIDLHDLNQHEEESSYAIRNSNEILFDHFNSLHDDFILFGLSFYLFALRLGVV